MYAIETARRGITAAELARGADISVTALVDALIRDAHAMRASDIHLDPCADGVTVRYRIDGVLQDVHTYPLTP